MDPAQAQQSARRLGKCTASACKFPCLSFWQGGNEHGTSWQAAYLEPGEFCTGCQAVCLHDRGAPAIDAPAGPPTWTYSAACLAQIWAHTHGMCRNCVRWRACSGHDLPSASTSTACHAQIRAGDHLLGVTCPRHASKGRRWVDCAQEDGLELVHARIGKQQGRVIQRHHAAAGNLQAGQGENYELCFSDDVSEGDRRSGEWSSQDARLVAGHLARLQ